jgi:hypothetical protein
MKKLVLIALLLAASPVAAQQQPLGAGGRQTHRNSPIPVLSARRK